MVREKNQVDIRIKYGLKKRDLKEKKKLKVLNSYRK